MLKLFCDACKKEVVKMDEASEFNVIEKFSLASPASPHIEEQKTVTRYMFCQECTKELRSKINLISNKYAK